MALILPRSLCWATKNLWVRCVTTQSAAMPKSVGMTATSANCQLVRSIIAMAPIRVNTALIVLEKLSAEPLRTVSVSLVMRLIRSPTWWDSR